MRYRMGINLGDIVIEGDDILGDGVNIAARLEGLAEAGGICISGDVFRQVRNKLDLAFEDLGEQRVKNIAEPVRTYRIGLDPQYDLALQFLGRAQFGLRHFEAAEASFKRRLIHKPRSGMTRAFLASLYGHLGRLDEARQAWREVMEINPDYSVAHIRKVLPYRNPTWFDHFSVGLQKAGLPE